MLDTDVYLNLVDKAGYVKWGFRAQGDLLFDIEIRIY